MATISMNAHKVFKASIKAIKQRKKFWDDMVEVILQQVGEARPEGFISVVAFYTG